MVRMVTWLLWLEKAYDRLEWSFIVDTLALLNLPSHLIDMLSCCLNSATLNINWNGSRTNAFNSSRGLRQGDPISPYCLFLL